MSISVVIISKDEPDLDDTLSLLAHSGGYQEVVVVDASEHRLSSVRDRHPTVRWIDFQAVPPGGVSIPQQRNAGVRAAHGEIIVFLDAGCRPEPCWLPALLAPLLDGSEDVVCGVVGAANPDGRPGVYDTADRTPERRYVAECPTINLAFRRQVFEAVGGFDEQFSYGSDVDFSWRLIDAGFRILQEPAAVMQHDWGTSRRQLRRAYAYGAARLRLYRKHQQRRWSIGRNDPVAVAYPLFLLGLPVALRYRSYLLLLLLPLWTNRHRRPAHAVANNLVFGAGVLRELLR